MRLLSLVARRGAFLGSSAVAAGGAYFYHSPEALETLDRKVFGVLDRPRTVDTVLAGLGLFGGCAALGWLEPRLGVKLFAPPMMASGIIFFVGPEPPNPKGFLSGSVCSATLSLGVLATLSPIMCPVAAQGAAAATLLMWYKGTGAIFPPAAVLSGALLTAAATASTPTLVSTVNFLAFPWFAGHAFLYGLAYALSGLRLQARIATTKHRLTSLGNDSDEELRAVFQRFDTSGDGYLDADELKVGLRAALGVELSREDCKDLVEGADKDGTGTVDFDEFRQICRHL